MNIRPVIHFAAMVVALTPTLHAADFFFGDPPDKTHPWAQHDHNRPQPPTVVPGDKPGAPPSDAIILFDGTEESFTKNWEHVREERKADWIVKDGAMQSMKGAGYIASKHHFGDCQLHVEWMAPSKIEGSGQGRGNSGVFLMGVAEVQVLDNFNNPTYADGTAGALYGVMPPMVNPLRGPGEWQTYDIIFRRPIVNDGVVVDEGRMTVLINGVLVQDATPLEGGGGWCKRTQPKSFGEVGPLKLQDHGNPVRFRNIWYREIRKRPVDGGTEGRLSEEATAAQRAENASLMIEQAKDLKGSKRMGKLLESLVYQFSDEVFTEVTALADAFVKDVQSQPAQLASRKNEVIKAYRALKYAIEQHEIIPSIKAFEDLDGIMEANKWKRK